MWQNQRSGTVTPPTPQTLRAAMQSLGSSRDVPPNIITHWLDADEAKAVLAGLAEPICGPKVEAVKG